MKKFLPLILLAVVLVFSSAILSGCIFNKKTAVAPEDVDIIEIDDSGEIDDQFNNEEIIVDEDIIDETELTDTDMEIEIDDLDEEMDSLELTGFEADNLADKDIGL